MVRAFLAAVVLGAGLAALGGGGGAAHGKVDDKPRVFTLAWSEYPSWSVFGVAAEEGLIDGEEGKLGPIEKKWNVDIKLQLFDYEVCMKSFQARTSDATCLTNMDALAPSLKRRSVAVLPTSTSVGGDACVVTGIKDVDELKKHKAYGLKGSVSEYAFYRILEKKFGQKEADYKFEMMDPEKAAAAMQNKDKDVDAIMVWNPFVLQTLKVRKDAKVLFDSSAIPEEIVDMVVIGQDVLDKPDGDRFACAVIDIYYEFNKKLADKAQREGLLKKLGAKFSNLSAEEMAQACEQARFYKTPDDALKLLEGEQLPKTMDGIVKFWVDHKFIEKGPKIGFGGKSKASEANLRFDPTYIKMVQDKAK
jgi:NitT/TauT family transport system substrate-binding protein